MQRTQTVTARHAANVRRHAAAAQRVLNQSAVGATAPKVLRTRFCTATGWHAYRDLTPAMRRIVLSADGGYGPVSYPKSLRTEQALVGMGLIERRGVGFSLTYHGELLWCELDEA